MHYVNGQKTGIAQSWYDNGQKYLETPYSPETGKRYGVQTKWYKNGNKNFEITGKMM